MFIVLLIADEVAPDSFLRCFNLPCTLSNALFSMILYFSSFSCALFPQVLDNDLLMLVYFHCAPRWIFICKR